MARTHQRSFLRNPTDWLFGTGASVAVLRELVLHGGELSAPTLVERTGLAASSVRDTLIDLEETRLVEGLGFRKSRLYRLRHSHPLAPMITTLFLHETTMFSGVESALKHTGQTIPGVHAVWLYGSVARGEDRPDSDVDVVVVTADGNSETVGAAFREAMHDSEDAMGVHISVLAIERMDIRRLSQENDPWWEAIVRDARVLHGPTPKKLLSKAGIADLGKVMAG